ncbi:hypothetical protein [Dyadobacter bucti]|uniref:hypothetical protein n=1 Tax=Dyadobacter bucti TaxID=2572203 RepID=UPI001107D9A7|nr:hypothetical protein [Dyadobacter bucti]
MEYIQKLRALMANLERSSILNKLSTKEDNQIDTLANALIDIEESLKKVINEHIPHFYQNELSEEEVEDIIFDIGEELRHLLYHINDTKVYNYLKPNSSD